MLEDADQSEANGLDWAVAGLLGGLASSLLLGLASKFLLRAPAAQLLVAPVIAGTIAGALLGLLSLDLHGSSMPKSLLVFFALWQAGYAASLAPLLRSRATG